ncbi:MAG: exodeoxyribonuclease VII large subunit [Bacilli bacterium]
MIYLNDQEKYLSISAITKYLKHKLDNDNHLQNVYLKGEISNFKAHSRGHLYFSLKDENSKINAIMFSTAARQVSFKIEEGMMVLVRGKISVYEPLGNYQIYIEEMLEDGIGNLYLAYEQLKKDLAKKGYFDEKRKKPLPLFPRRIGIVTAPTGAAIKDILSTINRRYPLCQTILFPSLVQGPTAHLEIVKQMKKAFEYEIDLLIIGRGGGSIEDLWSFNERIVAETIFHSPIPIISAVGHEIDFTISDFVADKRAATPTGAAEIAVPNLVDLLNLINQYKIRANEFIYHKLKSQNLILKKLKESYILKNPLTIYQAKEQTLDYILERLIKSMNLVLFNKKVLFNQLEESYIFKKPSSLYERPKQIIKHYIEKLEVLNPLKTLNRGYAILKKENKALSSIKNFQKEDNIDIVLHDGLLKAKIKEVEEKKDDKNRKV